MPSTKKALPPGKAFIGARRPTFTLIKVNERTDVFLANLFSLTLRPSRFKKKLLTTQYNRQSGVSRSDNYGFCIW